MSNPNVLGAVLVVLGAMLPVAIIQPAVVALPALQAILTCANAGVVALALYLNVRTPEK